MSQNPTSYTGIIAKIKNNSRFTLQIPQNNNTLQLKIRILSQNDLPSPRLIKIGRLMEFTPTNPLRKNAFLDFSTFKKVALKKIKSISNEEIKRSFVGLRINIFRHLKTEKKNHIFVILSVTYLQQAHSPSHSFILCKQKQKFFFFVTQALHLRVSDILFIENFHINRKSLETHLGNLDELV